MHQNPSPTISSNWPSFALARRFHCLGVMETAALIAVGLGAATLVMGLGVFTAASLRRVVGRPERLHRWAGTIGVVTTAIAQGGVGRIAHRRLGARAALPARSYDGSLDAPVGTVVVVIEVRDGMALVAPMD